MNDSRPHLKRYVPSILAFKDGAVNLGNMIANADCVEELRENYTADNIRVAAAALLDEKYLHGFVKFAKSVSRDEELWGSVVGVFESKINYFPRKWTEESLTMNYNLLNGLCDKYPEFCKVFQAKPLKSNSPDRTASLGTGQTPSPC